VVDVVLGDPNNDGRFELLLAIWQVDASGNDRSQPNCVLHDRRFHAAFSLHHKFDPNYFLV
jgi:hypothetical protein